MAINLSTAGIHLYYAVETTKGTRPTKKSNYTDLTGVKTTPDLNPAPDTLETTTLNETEWKTYIDGLKDMGGALEFNFNLTQELVDLWDALMTAYETGKGQGMATWFLIDIPGLTEGFYFPGNPSSMGIPSTEVSNVLEITNRITPTGAPEKAEKPTAD
mgnify:CR=1 FL=1